jgi:hypothetical protein
MPQGKWIGPLKIDELLNQAVAVSPIMPPAADSAYLVSRKPWKDAPDPSCEALYIGGNTGVSERFRTRIGDLIADLFGFYSGQTGHHSGGISLNKYCKQESFSPGALHRVVGLI